MQIITAVAHNSQTQTSVDVTNLSWEQRLALHSAYKSTIAKSAGIFGVTADEFKKAKAEHTADSAFDTTPYAELFAKRKSHDEHGNIITKPRGRPTSKIADAFNAVTTTRVPLSEFCAQHKVSEHVMRQRKRFASDNHSDVVCRKINGVTHIWRQTEEEQATQQVSDVVEA